MDRGVVRKASLTVSITLALRSHWLLLTAALDHPALEHLGSRVRQGFRGLCRESAAHHDRCGGFARP
jgi:hypothetical protein